MVIMGLDLSLKSSGVFICTDNYKCLYSGAIKNKTMLQQYNIIKQLIQDYGVTDASIEDIFYSRSIKTVKELAQLHGAILIAIKELDINCKYYSVMSAKKFAIGKLTSKKTDGTKKKSIDYKLEVKEKMEKVFKLDFGSELDISDASSLCYAYIKELKKI